MITAEIVQDIKRISQHLDSSDSSQKTPLTLRGRQFNVRELEIISRCVREHYNEGRTAISRSICEKLNWRQPNGWLKDRACRDVLHQLEEKGLFTLPPSRKTSSVSNQKLEKDYLRDYNLVSPIRTFPQQITLEFAKGNKEEKVWNQAVKRYHYLGHKVAVGQCIKYLVKAEGDLVGAIAFSSPAWRLTPRDALLSACMDASEVHNLVINNSRFLILPHVEVRNLASAILALATKQVVVDWALYYSVTPLVVETFVEPSRFLGTCYRAANWIEIGVTQGYAKKGSSYHNSQKPKQIFLYGLSKTMRRKLLDLVKEDRSSSGVEAR